MARPRKAIKRQHPVKVSYTLTEYKLLQKLADKHGLSLAEFARHKSLDHKVRARLTPEEANYYRQLAGMANNLNQLAHAANSGMLFTQQILKTLENINTVIEKLR